MEEFSTDILVIGSGLSGILSALEAGRSGLQVLLLGKFAIGMGTNTSMATCIFTASNSKFSKEDHLKATLESGRGLSQRRLAKILVEEGYIAIEKLRGYGIPMVERGMGYIVDRSETSSRLTGVIFIKNLMKRLRNSFVKLLPGLVIFELIVDEGKVQGAFGFLKDGKPCLIKSKAVILAAGGAGAAYRRNDNQKSILGDGYALALRAGLPLLDLEFVQFFPLVHAEPRLSTFCIYPPYPKERRLFNERGEDLFEKFGIGEDLTHTIITQRDRFCIALYEASQKGNIYFDLTQVPEEKWEHYPLNFLKKSKFPFSERPFLVSPAAHFFMGGVEIDGEGKTALSGLFAAGEVAWGIHGANRVGGNALTECAVFGPIAGRSAAKYARMKQEEKQPSNFHKGLKKKWEKKSKEYIEKESGTLHRPGDLLKDLKYLAWKNTGPIREEGSLKEGLEQLASLEKRIERVYPATLQDLFKMKEVKNVALVLRAILNGSLLRKESRGSFCRKDFPNQDDQNWLKNTCYYLDKGELRVTYRNKNWD